MIDELFPFQKNKVAELRDKIALAKQYYASSQTAQVVSLQAPTGSGKTIMMSSLIEDIYFGTAKYPEQPDAIFVWLSDSPELNRQSKDKIDFKADKIAPGRTIEIEEDSFDQEMLEDGKIYFLNTQKLSRTGKLGKIADGRQWTIWQTLNQTVKEKSDRLYFIIDEAHRGMQGQAAAGATTIMQRFIKGCEEPKLLKMPLVIGMSATPERFNRLIRGIDNTLHQVIVTPEQVKASGLLKDTIIVTYPTAGKDDPIAVLISAAEDWKLKCERWHRYCKMSGEPDFNPVMVIQVLSGSNGAVSDTDLDMVVAKIEAVLGKRFEEGEVVHAFGSSGLLTINGLTVPHVEASKIQDDVRAKVVFFKESLATGWDCPRAETMMSFRVAEDKTYIAQLLGRMIRTPLQHRITADEILNNVRLFLPKFNESNVNAIVNELRSPECGDIPADIETDYIGSSRFANWSIYNAPRKKQVDDPSQDFFDFDTPSNVVVESPSKPLMDFPFNEPILVEEPIRAIKKAPEVSQPELNVEIDRAGIIRVVRDMALKTYNVHTAQNTDYIVSAMSLASLLARAGLDCDAKDRWVNLAMPVIRNYAEEARRSGKYRELENQIRKMKLSSKAFDVASGAQSEVEQMEMAFVSDDTIERRCRIADQKLGGCGFVQEYGKRFVKEDNIDEYKIDCIIFSEDNEAVDKLRRLAKATFNDMKDEYRRRLAHCDTVTKAEYNQICYNCSSTSEHNFELPEQVQGFADEEGDVYTNHLYLDETGVAKIKLNSWEKETIEEEAKREDFVCWIRNLSRRPTSLCIPYQIDGVDKPMYPDFLVIRKDFNTEYVVDILEPHGNQYVDNLPKAKGLAAYAESEDKIGRVQMIRKNSLGRLVRLDFSKSEIREEVRKARNDEELNALFDKYGQ